VRYYRCLDVYLTQFEVINAGLYYFVVKVHKWDTMPISDFYGFIKTIGVFLTRIDLKYLYSSLELEFF
jgi:hypothetical protein